MLRIKGTKVRSKKEQEELKVNNTLNPNTTSDVILTTTTKINNSSIKIKRKITRS